SEAHTRRKVAGSSRRTSSSTLPPCACHLSATSARNARLNLLGVPRLRPSGFGVGPPRCQGLSTVGGWGAGFAVPHSKFSWPKTANGCCRALFSRCIFFFVSRMGWMRMLQAFEVLFIDLLSSCSGVPTRVERARGSLVQDRFGLV